MAVKTSIAEKGCKAPKGIEQLDLAMKQFISREHFGLHARKNLRRRRATKRRIEKDHENLHAIVKDKLSQMEPLRKEIKEARCQGAVGQSKVGKSLEELETSLSALENNVCVYLKEKMERCSRIQATVNANKVASGREKLQNAFQNRYGSKQAFKLFVAEVGNRVGLSFLIVAFILGVVFLSHHNEALKVVGIIVISSLTSLGVGLILKWMTTTDPVIEKMVSARNRVLAYGYGLLDDANQQSA